METPEKERGKGNLKRGGNRPIVTLGGKEVCPSGEEFSLLLKTLFCDRIKKNQRGLIGEGKEERSKCLSPHTTKKKKDIDSHDPKRVCPRENQFHEKKSTGEALVQQDRGHRGKKREHERTAQTIGQNTGSIGLPPEKGFRKPEGDSPWEGRSIARSLGRKRPSRSVVDEKGIKGGMKNRSERGTKKKSTEGIKIHLCTKAPKSKTGTSIGKKINHKKEANGGRGDRESREKALRSNKSLTERSLGKKRLLGGIY